MSRCLSQWLQWQETLHPQSIDLGLQRIQTVARRLHPEVFHVTGSQQLPFKCILVGGTNGKGSTIAFLSSILQSAGYKTGVYTSPHLLKYNERICIDQQMIEDQQLCRIFATIDKARGDISLTYFEFSTLAAITYFIQQACEVVIMEVGMGGRLDAVNILDADVSLVTTVDLDHQQWLGDSIEKIAFEKAGIFKKNRIAIYGDAPIANTMIQVAKQKKSFLIRYQHDYDYTIEEQAWSLQLRILDRVLEHLPHPAIAGNIQYLNAANAIMTLMSIASDLPQLHQQHICEGLQQASIMARYQILSQQPLVIADVAHNPQAVRLLKQYLEHPDLLYENSTTSRITTIAFFAIMQDKDYPQIIDIMADSIDHWVLPELDIERALPMQTLASAIHQKIKNTPLQCYNRDITFEQILSSLKQQYPSFRLIIFGSFYTIAKALEYYHGTRTAG